MSLSEIENNIRSVQAAVVKACEKVSRDFSNVHLLAVSKFQSVEKIERAYDCGLRNFGENYVQELLEKKNRLSHLAEIRWHLIGHLQSNKSKQALSGAHFFHALDSLKLAKELEKQAQAFNMRGWPVFVQVNVDDESSKSGVSLSSVEELVSEIKKRDVFDLRGLMCIPDASRPTRDAFKKLALLNDQLGLSELSMGMSEDFEVAVEEGSNWVRVGRKIFGDRQ